MIDYYYHQFLDGIITWDEFVTEAKRCISITGRGNLVISDISVVRLEQRNALLVRVDDEKNPEFWMQITIML